MTVTLAETPLPSVVDTTISVPPLPPPSLTPGLTTASQPQPPTANDPGATDN
jgi:hypothetical protein